MICFIKIQFDKRQVGEKLDLSESIAKKLERKGIVSFEEIEQQNENKVKTKKSNKNEKVN